MNVGGRGKKLQTNRSNWRIALDEENFIQFSDFDLEQIRTFHFRPHRQRSQISMETHASDTGGMSDCSPTSGQENTCFSFFPPSKLLSQYSIQAVLFSPHQLRQIGPFFFRFCAQKVVRVFSLGFALFPRWLSIVTLFAGVRLAGAIAEPVETTRNKG